MHANSQAVAVFRFDLSHCLLACGLAQTEQADRRLDRNCCLPLAEQERRVGVSGGPPLLVQPVARADVMGALASRAKRQ
jgi:hypothetical protein